jgi:hypothetical protein
MKVWIVIEGSLISNEIEIDSFYEEETALELVEKLKGVHYFKEEKKNYWVNSLSYIKLVESEVKTEIEK